MNQEKNSEIEEIKKEIVIERLRQTSPKVRISFGGSDKFMDREELIEEVKKGTEIGENIIRIQIAYLQAFKKGILTKT